MACELADPLFESSSRVVACTGLGYVSTEERVQPGGGGPPASFGERLVEIR